MTLMKKFVLILTIIFLGVSGVFADDTSEMLERQRRVVGDLARAGVAERDNGKVDDALRHLYRAYVMLQSLPSPSEETAKVGGEERHSMNSGSVSSSPSETAASCVISVSAITIILFAE